MLLLLGGVTLVLALAAIAGLQVSATRLRVGLGDRGDLTTWTGIWSAAELAALPGVRRQRDGGLGFDPRHLPALPLRPWRRWLDAPAAHGAALAAALAASGQALLAAEPGPLPWLVLAPAFAQQVMTRAWAVVLAVRDG